MRRASLQAPREAPARLFVNGEFFGLYTIVEDVDDTYLNRIYGESSGYLYDFNPVRGYHFGYLGEDPASYGVMFGAKSHEDDPQWSKLFEMLREINNSNEETFPAVGPTYVDVAGLMKLLAVQNYVDDSDAILSDVWGMNNFYLYRPETSRQFRFSPGIRISRCPGPAVRFCKTSMATNSPGAPWKSLASGRPTWRQFYIRRRLLVQKTDGFAMRLIATTL